MYRAALTRSALAEFHLNLHNMQSNLDQGQLTNTICGFLGPTLQYVSNTLQISNVNNKPIKADIPLFSVSLSYEGQVDLEVKG